MEKNALAPAAMVAANDLPLDLVFEILSKLPVKSLLRFKSLSKAFDSLIGNPTFMSKHLISQTQSVSHFEPINPGNSDLGMYSLYSRKLDDQVADVQSLLPCRVISYRHVGDYKLPTIKEELSAVACCRGLVCLASNHWDRTRRTKLFLWNPATRTTKLIYKAPPAPARDKWRRVPHRNILYGFGYDSRANDCKLAMLNKLSGKFQVYSVNSGTWGSVKDVGFKLRSKSKTQDCYSMVSINGHLYWLQNRTPSSSSSKFAIQSYSFSDDLIQEIALPEECGGCMCVRITELEGNLCLLVAHSQPAEEPLHGKEVHLWVMKEEVDLQVSWIKTSFTVNPMLHSVDQVIRLKGFIIYSYFDTPKVLSFSIVGSSKPYKFIICSQVNQHPRPILPTSALCLYRETLLQV